MNLKEYVSQIKPEGNHFFRERFTHLPVQQHPLSLYKRDPLYPDDIKNFLSPPFEEPTLGDLGQDLSSDATVAYATSVLDARVASQDSYFMLRDVPITDDMAFLKFSSHSGTSDILGEAMLESDGELHDDYKTNLTKIFF